MVAARKSAETKRAMAKKCRRASSCHPRPSNALPGDIMRAACLRGNRADEEPESAREERYKLERGLAARNRAVKASARMPAARKSYARWQSGAHSSSALAGVNHQASVRARRGFPRGLLSARKHSTRRRAARRTATCIGACFLATPARQWPRGRRQVSGHLAGTQGRLCHRRRWHHLYRSK